MILPTPMTRREHFASLAALALFAPASVRAAAGGGAEPFSWEILVSRAKALAGRRYQPVQAREHAHGVDYDSLGQIAYRADKTLWPSKTANTSVRFFPLSRYAQVPVEIATVQGGRATPFRYDPLLFDAKSAEMRALLTKSDGFAGFRALNPRGVGDWLAFQGASYFRSSGVLNQYGLSARGLAIDTSVPGVSEEFPTFTHFWLEQGPEDSLIIYALLDSASITGAYRFVNRKNAQAVTQDITLALFPRKAIAQLGIAPLTSMFWYGEGNRPQATDWRPEVHDSDGLALLTGKGERLWRPLANPPHPATNSFSDHNPKGFGLLQRDRNFDHYQDDGVFYEKRPSLWVEPRGDWGDGAVVLFELPTNKEYEDNVVAFWSPASPVRAGQRLDYAYRLNWIGDEPQPLAVARATDVWQGAAGRPGHDPIPHARKLVIDFAGDGLDRYARGQVDPVIEVSRGTLIEAHAYPVEGAKGRWRLTADIGRGRDESSDLRVFLKAGSTALTETVLYQVHWNND